MKKKKLLFVLLYVLGTSVLPAFPQNSAVTVIDYMPAPGQHINIESIGTPPAAQKIVENTSSLVSLGSFGGYIVFKFKKACVNHPGNPYGVDFTIFGNAFLGSSEPGIVRVMKDSNQNGLPDDTWYEIAGSSHFFPETVRNYKVIYFKTSTRDVLWKDNLGSSGRISANEFNLQEYYPLQEYFPSYPRDSVSFAGTLLKNEIIRWGTGEITIAPPIFGYADSHSRVQEADLAMPDNPYTKETEGAGGDPVDISWASDSEGNYVDLDSIHFLKIESASLNNAGWLGELSTDVAWVEPVLPNPLLTGKEMLLIYNQHPSKVILGDSLTLAAFYFERGRITDEPVIFHSDNDEVATVDASGLLKTHSTGEAKIRFTALEEMEFTSIKVVVPESIRFVTDFSSFYPGDTLEINAEVYDNNYEPLNLTLDFLSSNPSAGKVIMAEGRFYLVALQPGEITLTASVEEFDLNKTLVVKVHSFDQKLNVLLTIKTADENLLPLQTVEVGLADLNFSVENRQHDYSGLEKVTLFHALVAGLQKANVPFNFRDDEAAGGKLYLYMIENDGLFSYGWGGKATSAATARGWIARLNNNQYLNDFDNILISEGDSIVLYHVPNLLSGWKFTRILPDKLSSAPREEVEILVEESFCTYQNGEIKETEFSPLFNVPVTAGETWYTDVTGRVRIIPEGDFPLLISSGNDALLISQQTTVSAFIHPYIFTLYPNPVRNRLIINYNSGSYKAGKHTLQIVDSAGRLVIEKEVSSVPAVLDFSNLVQGMYQLVLTDGKDLEIHKIIKQ